MTGMQLLQALENPAQRYLEECEKAARPRYIRWFAAAACLCLVLAVGIPLYRQYGYYSNATTPGGYEQTSEAGGGWNGMPDRIRAQAPTVVGTGFTREEIENELNKWRFFYDETQGVSWADATVAETGFRHVSLTEDGNEVRMNYYDIPILYDGRIGAMLTVFRIDTTGEVSSQISYGGTGWDRLNAILDAHPGEDLLMVYVGYFMEAVITPEGEILDRREAPADEPAPEITLQDRFAGDVNWYQVLYSPECMLNSASIAMAAPYPQAALQSTTTEWNGEDHYFSAILPEMPEDELFRKSMRILRGTVTDGSSALRVRAADGREQNFTDYEVEVLETLKGDAPDGTVTIRVSGGTAGGVRETWDPSPALEAGQEYLLFLYRPNMGGLNTQGDQYYIVGVLCGVFEETSPGVWKAQDGRELTLDRIRARAAEYPVDEDYVRKEYSANQKRNLDNGILTQAEYDRAMKNMDVYAEVIG